MLSRSLLLSLLVLPIVGGGSSLNAQAPAPSATAERMVRVTYPIADIIVPIPGKSSDGDKALFADDLVQIITKTIAPTSWEKLGGNGSIQYFPNAMAIVVNQTASVHGEIASLVAGLRRLTDEQICVEMRLLTVTPSMAKHLYLAIDEHGQPISSVAASNSQPTPFTAMADKQLAALMKMAQSDDATVVQQLPKMTLFNAQRARLTESRVAAGDELAAPSNSFTCDVLPVLDGEKRFVRLTLDLQHYSAIDKGAESLRACRTFMIPPGRTLVWHAGHTRDRRQLFVLVTPCVLVPEERLFIGEIKPIPAGADRTERRGESGTEEQAIPLRITTPPRIDAKPAIEKRLREPISLNLKNVPLKQAVKDIAVAAGVIVYLDLEDMRRSRINIDAAVSLSVDGIPLKSALNFLFDSLGLTYVVENDAIKIMTAEKRVRYYRRTYEIRDLVDWAARDFSKKNGDVGVALKELIQETVSRQTWEALGGKGSIQYLPNEKTLVIQQSQEAHDDVELLLASLRKLYEVSVEVSVGVVHASPKSAKELRKAMAQAGGKNRAVLTMNQTQLDEFLKLAQADRANQLTQAPLMTLLNAQRSPIDLTISPRAHYSFEAHPVATPDRRAVRLDLRVELRTADEIRFVEHVTRGVQKMEVPTGDSMVWDLGKTANRQHVFLVVQPRVRVSEPPAEKGASESPIPGR